MRKSRYSPSQMPRMLLSGNVLMLRPADHQQSPTRRDQKATSIMTSAPAAIFSAPLFSTDLYRSTLGLASFRREDIGAETVVHLEGSFDALSAPAARPALDAVVNDRRSPVAIDMSALRSIDSLGVGAVVNLYKRVRAQGGQASVQGLKGQPLAIFQLLRLERLMAAS